MIISIDFETYSECDIRSAGAYAYNAQAYNSKKSYSKAAVKVTTEVVGNINDI